MAHVRFQNVSKIYTRRSRQFLFRYVWDALAGRQQRRDSGGFYALRDVSFELRDGDTLGIVGHNGAGKSTLLSLVAGLTAPEEGSVDVRGRLSALLELGGGFHPDLTGAENLYINAALCGMTRREAEEAFDRIVEFSELGEFIHEPLRTYSAGMVMRLAFSVAVQVEPEILLIDEILAVGDKDFQKKCADRILEMRDRGAILICVSHAADTLRELCKRGLWIESGQVVMHGEADEVFDAYESSKAAARPAS